MLCFQVRSLSLMVACRTRTLSLSLCLLCLPFLAAGLQLACAPVVSRVWLSPKSLGASGPFLGFFMHADGLADALSTFDGTQGGFVAPFLPGGFPSFTRLGPFSQFGCDPTYRCVCREGEGGTMRPLSSPAFHHFGVTKSFPEREREREEYTARLLCSGNEIKCMYWMSLFRLFLQQQRSDPNPGDRRRKARVALSM